MNEAKQGCRWVLLNPTGNLTALVLDSVAPALQAEVTRCLMEISEQVAYLEPPRDPDALAAIRLMGGEFCGNAAMAAACWLAFGETEPSSRTSLRAGRGRWVSLEVSGAKTPLDIRVRHLGDQFEGTVPMPPVDAIFPTFLGGESFMAVRMEGILHLIREEGPPLSKDAAENLLRQAASLLPDPAVGLLQWRRDVSEMIPLVLVKGSDTLVWETGCGSGSAAVGAWEAVRRGSGVTETAVRQPGGTIRVRAEVTDGAITDLTICGRVRFERTGCLEIQAAE